MRVRLIPPAIEMLGTALIKLEPPVTPGIALAPGATIPTIPYVSPFEVAQTRVDSIGLEMTRTLADTRKLLAHHRGLADTRRPLLTPSAKAPADSLQGVLGDSRRAIARLTKLANANEPQLTRTLASLDTSSVLVQYLIRQVPPVATSSGTAPAPGPQTP